MSLGSAASDCRLVLLFIASAILHSSNADKKIEFCGPNASRGVQL